VKDLARQTAEATANIGSELNTMQTALNKTVSAIQQIAKVNLNLKDYSAQILRSVQEQNTTVSEMAHTLSSADTVSKAIANGVTQASNELQGAQNSIHEIRNSSTETAESIASIKQSLSQMQSLANDFEKVGI